MSDVYRLIKAIDQFKILDWYLVESDSSDGTVVALKELSNQIRGFNFVSMGNLSSKFPERIDRLIHCRNQYLKFVKNDIKYDYDYIIVMDFDGINDELTKEAFWSCWNRIDWDVVTANQDGPYYDIWALKHKLWNPIDCFQQADFFGDFMYDYLSKLLNVSFKQIRVPKDSDWIEVESAFGGIAIYKFNAFLQGKSYSFNENTGVVCDSISFHNNIVNNGMKIFINPAFINAKYTEHTNWLKPGIKRLKFKLSIILLVLFGSKTHSFIKKILKST